MSSNHFTWQDNDEDELRARCLYCAWLGPWRDQIRDVLADERNHECEASA